MGESPTVPPGGPAVGFFHRIHCKKPQRIDRQLIQFPHNTSLFSGVATRIPVFGPKRSAMSAKYLSLIVSMREDPDVREMAGKFPHFPPSDPQSDIEILPSHRSSPSHFRVKITWPAPHLGFPMSANETQPTWRHSRVLFVFQPSSVKTTRKWAATITRSLFLERCGAADDRACIFLCRSCRTPDVYRDCSVRQTARPGRRLAVGDRSEKLDIFGVGPHSGMAAPVGCPEHSLLGISGASQICSGSMPPAEVNRSDAAM